MSSPVPKRSAVLLWVLAPGLLALSLYRPFVASEGRADALPTRLQGYRLKTAIEVTARHTSLLGTSDAAWRTYVADDGTEVDLIAVFHVRNWKSVHPPHMCIEGSNMSIQTDETRRFRLADGSGEGEVGLIRAFSHGDQRESVSLYVYGADGLLTPSYLGFVAHHAPRALLRQSTSGFLLRVATWGDGDGGTAAAEARCADFLAKILVAAQASVRDT